MNNELVGLLGINFDLFVRKELENDLVIVRDEVELVKDVES